MGGCNTDNNVLGALRREDLALQHTNAHNSNLRNPVDRAYSHWAMETKRGLETWHSARLSN